MLTRQNRHQSDTVHRGLTAADMPGRRAWRGLTFALFLRGKYPPKVWRVPADLEGPALAQLLEERAKMSNRRKSR